MPIFWNSSFTVLFETTQELYGCKFPSLLSSLAVLCRGSTKDTRGTAYVVYDDIYDAKNAVDHLSGFNVANRYLIVLYYNANRQNKKVGGFR